MLLGLPNESLSLNIIYYYIVAGVDICHDTVTRRLAEYKEVPACMSKPLGLVARIAQSAENSC